MNASSSLPPHAPAPHNDLSPVTVAVGAVLGLVGLVAGAWGMSSNDSVVHDVLGPVLMGAAMMGLLILLACTFTNDTSSTNNNDRSNQH